MHFGDLEKKVALINKNRWKPQLREVYLKKKNMYLDRNDSSHPSFVVYVEAVNEVCQTMQSK